MASLRSFLVHPIRSFCKSKQLQSTFSGIQNVHCKQFHFTSVSSSGVFDFFQKSLRRPKRKTRPITHDIVRLGTVSPFRAVPVSILYPDYVLGPDETSSAEIDIKNEKEQQCMRESCRIARKILNEAENQIGVGVETDKLDEYVHNLCIENNCYPSPLKYRGFPKSVCTSVNNVAVHGIPDNRPLKDGDIICIDVSIFYQGYHGDCAGTYAVGNVDKNGIDLIWTTQECLESAISICRPGEKFNMIGTIIEKTAKEYGFDVIPSCCGHGIGTYFHGPPDILHYNNDYPGEMQQGMIFTIEPVITEGDVNIHILEDGWTAVTNDHCRTAQFEHTILITETGNEILTIDLKDE